LARRLVCACAFAALAAVAAVACTPHIGDKCTINTDCSISNTRQCDTSQPSGYCTIISCGPNSCPDNAACVLFGANVPGCPYDDYAAPARTGRTYCMQTCQSDSDCRHDDGYRCQDPTMMQWSAQIVDDNPVSHRVCILISDVDAATSSGVPPAVCPGGVAPPGADAAVAEAGGPGPGEAGGPMGDGAADAPADAADGGARDANATPDAVADAAGDAAADGAAEAGADAASDAGGDAAADAPAEGGPADGSASDAGGGG
jgi:hypothetical protein